MLRFVKQVRYEGGWRLWLKFDDGAEGTLDLRDLIEFTGVFAPLSDPGYVARVRVNDETETIEWPNEADIDPVVLYCHATGTPLPDWSRRTTIASE